MTVFSQVETRPDEFGPLPHILPRLRKLLQEGPLKLTEHSLSAFRSFQSFGVKSSKHVRSGKLLRGLGCKLPEKKN